MNTGTEEPRVRPLDEAAAGAAAACLFKGLADTSRMAILQHLLLGEHNVAELTAHLGLAQSTVSKHLACLRDCGLVVSRPSGRSSLFSVAHPEPVVALLAAAEQLLAATGDAVVGCATYGLGSRPAHGTGHGTGHDTDQGTGSR